MNAIPKETKPTVRRGRLAVLMVGCIAAWVLVGVLFGTASSARSELFQRRERATLLAADVSAIQRLRTQPRQATETQWGAADLLAQVGAAMKAGGVAPAALVSTNQQPLMRAPGSGYGLVVHRLSFENVTIEALARFAYALLAGQPELIISSIQLRSTPRSETWSAEIGVAYRVFVAEKMR